MANNEVKRLMNIDDTITDASELLEQKIFKVYDPY